MNLLSQTVLWILYISAPNISGMRESEIYSSALVCCMNLKRQKDPILQSLVDKFNDSLALILTPPFDRDGFRVRLQLIGNASVGVGIKAKYLSPAPKIIFHVTPHEDFLDEFLIPDEVPKEDIGWSNPFRYLDAKWKEDPTNRVTYVAFNVFADPQKIRKRILTLLREMEHTKHLYSHLWVHFPGDQFNYDRFGDWVNKMFADDPELFQNLMKHCVQCIYHDHNTPIINALKKMPYIDYDVRRIQENMKDLINDEYPRYDRLHPRLTFHYFKNKDALLARGSKLWDDLLYEPRSITLVHAVAATPATSYFWKLNHFNQSINRISDLGEFNIIFPLQMSKDIALSQCQEFENIQFPSGTTEAKTKLLEHLTAILLYTRPEITFAAANALRSTVKPKMQKTIGRIIKVVNDIWDMMARTNCLSVGNLTASNERFQVLLKSVMLMVETELKIKVPNDRKERNQYMRFWKDFAKLVEVESMQNAWEKVVPLELMEIGDKLEQHSPRDSLDGMSVMYFETILYWKCIDLRLDPSYDVHVITLDSQRNPMFDGSEGLKLQKRIEFYNLLQAVGCSELIDHKLLRWRYYEKN